MDRQRGTGVRAPQSRRRPATCARGRRLRARRGSTFIARTGSGTRTECRARFRTRPGACDVAQAEREDRQRRQEQSVASIERQRIHVGRSAQGQPAANRPGRRPSVAAAERRARRPRPRRGNRCRLSLVEQRLLRRLLRVRHPWLGWYPTYDPVSSGGGRDVTGAVRLKVKPEDASVYVDGYYVGLVDDFDGAFQRLHLEPGQHHMEVRLPDYDDLSFDVLIQPGQTTTYHGTMHREE